MVIKEDMYSDVQEMEDLIINTLGTEEALNAITKALDVDTKNDIYKYIIRVYDLSNEEDLEEGLEDYGFDDYDDYDDRRNDSGEWEFDGYVFDPYSPWTQIYKDVIEKEIDRYWSYVSDGSMTQEEAEEFIDSKISYLEQDFGEFPNVKKAIDKYYTGE